jgi:7-cyano-7-deazaguanine synthase in queuosine biosynthesis
MTTYTYSLSADFPSGLGSLQLQKAISSSAISQTISHINTNDDVVEIIFFGSLSGDDVTALNGLISAHVPVKSKAKFYVITPIRNTITVKNAWTLAAYFKYGGSSIIGTINYFEISSYMEGTITSYDARVVNKSTGEVLAAKTGMTNVSSAIYDMGTVSNVPTTETTLELQIKKNAGANGDYVTIDSLIIYYDN